jgi:DNA-binding MarR family transcriptional regulator
MTDTSKRTDKSIGAALTLAARLHRARSAELLADIGLYPGQDRALELLSDGDVASMGDLASALQVKPPTASKMIARLAQQGLVTRAGVAKDARRVNVVLTEEGRRRVELLPDLADALETELIDGLDGKDRKRLRKLLRKATRNLAVVNGDAVERLEEPEADDEAESETPPQTAAT